MKSKEKKEYYENGQLWQHCFFLNGKLHGECKSYRENGQLMYHYFYLNDKIHGEYKYYYENGQICEHRFYLNHKQIDAPFMKSKPKRLPFKSNRSRFQTLEVL